MSACIQPYRGGVTASGGNVPYLTGRPLLKFVPGNYMESGTGRKTNEDLYQSFQHTIASDVMPASIENIHFPLTSGSQTQPREDAIYRLHGHTPYLKSQLQYQRRRQAKQFTIDAILGQSSDTTDLGNRLTGSEMIKDDVSDTSHPPLASTRFLRSSPFENVSNNSALNSHHPKFRMFQDRQRRRFSDGEASSGNRFSSSSDGNPWKPGSRGKRIRTIFTTEQLQRLEEQFELQQYMVGTERYYLASSLHLTEAQVKVWFQNRRIKWRKQSMERQHAKMAAIDVYDENEASDNDDDDDDDVGHYSDCDHVVKLDESSVDDTMTSYADQNDDRPRGDPPGGTPDFDLNHEPM